MTLAPCASGSTANVPQGSRSPIARRPQSAHRRSFGQARLEEIAIKGERVAARFSNGELITLVRVCSEATGATGWFTRSAGTWSTMSSSSENANRHRASSCAPSLLGCSGGGPSHYARARSARSCIQRRPAAVGGPSAIERAGSAPAGERPPRNRLVTAGAPSRMRALICRASARCSGCGCHPATLSDVSPRLLLTAHDGVRPAWIFLPLEKTKRTAISPYRRGHA